MRPKKIIHIYSRSYNAYFPAVDSDDYYLNGWSGAIAKHTLRQTDKYLIEDWRAERDVKMQTTRQVEGVLCRLFPSFYSKIFGEWSPGLIRQLKEEVKNNDVLIHHSSIHARRLYFIAWLFRKTPIIAQHHGEPSPLERFREHKKLTSLIAFFLERAALKNVDYFFVLRNKEKELLSKFLPPSRISWLTMGTDFDEFTPIDKHSARQQLGLAQDKKIMLYVGRFYKVKEVDIILKTYTELKQKYNLELILIGGSLCDPLFEDVFASGARFFGFLPHSALRLYYSAADVYVLPGFRYFGWDVAMKESFACNTPAVSPCLSDLPEDIKHELGEEPKSREDVTSCIEKVLQNPEKYGRCRQIAEKIFDWKNVIRQVVEVYDRLFEVYYPVP